MKVSIIAALSSNRVIGSDNELLWRIPADFARMKELTTGKPLVMGRKTHESIGRALPGRLNVIVTRQPHYVSEGCVVVSSLLEGLAKAEDAGKGEVFIFGGEQIYRQALDLKLVDVLYLTEVQAQAQGDAFFPDLDMEQFEEVEREHHDSVDDQPAFDFVVYERKN